MIFYCIRFERKGKDGTSKHNFFVYAETKEKAIKRFMEVGYSRMDILSINEVCDKWDC